MTHLQKIRFLIPLCFLSCTTSQVEDVFPQEEEQSAIGFQAKVNARALNTLDDVQQHGYAVWGGFEDMEVFSGNEVTYSSGEWGYGEPKYWVLNKEYTFFATYPQSANVTATDGTYKLSVQTPAEADLDILTASAYTDTRVTGFSPEVSFQFTHLMTRINIQLEQDFDKNSDDDFTVTKVTLSGIKPEGTYQVTNSGNTFTGAWTMGNATTSYERTFSADEQKTLRELSTLLVWGTDGLLLIPQAITSASVKVGIDYLYHMKDSQDDPEADYVEIYLPASADLWQSGMMVTYSAKISEEHNIYFLAPTVEPWGAPQTGGTIIIK